MNYQIKILVYFMINQCLIYACLM